ncbi:helix-turn-helix domain-containing protein [Flavobacterium undicola]|uniref:helix-turn-helix domain-containing protein n=1 Tax=Flavobacterium undicola TaxID=1932779 RepID=UPI001378158B|nr:helix-turn-helix transcriptional regulator [Flavobacterium undicola]MBA0885372.1 helix-turn-helix transcriptional regulator [Flavobacterium undicola]
MVNTDDFIKRLEIILDYYGINASAFADKIGVQRSSLSHLLSGRNKPSLDFILKILDVYPEVDLYWILNGKGSFPKNSSKPTELETTTNFNPIPATTTAKLEVNEDLFSKSSIEETTTTSSKHSNEIVKNLFEEDIEKIVFFYKDGTFKTFSPNAKK